MIGPAQHPLIMAMLQHMQAQPPQQQPGQAPQGGKAAIARAMLGRVGHTGRVNASLAALPAWREHDHAQSFGGVENPSQGAFQGDAFQYDAFQTE